MSDEQIRLQVPL